MDFINIKDQTKYKDTYRIASSRLQSWDYRWNGAYFITICTKNREPFFGDIKNDIMRLSHVGVLADVLWHEIKNHANNTLLSDYVIMPNHVHGILILANNETEYGKGNANTVARRDVACNVSTTCNASTKNKFMSGISPKSGSISTIIRSYKSAVTKHAHRLGYEFSWQTRFHDHIIRNEKSFQQISEYIRTNPRNWGKDKFYTEAQ